MEKLTISVCIPCVKSHIKYLPDCLNSITQQTHKPTEILISISGLSTDPVEFEKTKKEVDLLLTYYPELNIITSFTSDNLFAGENRNKAIKMSMGEIITFIDADDIMRCDRLYTLYMIFSLYPDIYIVLHKFHENKYPTFRDGSINFDKDKVKPYVYSEELHFGHSSFRRPIFYEYKYSSKPRGQDIEFIDKLLNKYISCIAIYDQALTYYISDRSTFYNLENSCADSKVTKDLSSV